MLNDATPSFRELLLNRLTPPDDQDHVRVIVRLKQRETLTVVESAIKVDGLDPGVKGRRGHRKNSARTLLAVSPSLRRRTASVLAFVLHTRVECGHRRGTQWFHASLPVIEAVCVVFVTVVGPQVEVCADLHLFGEQFIEILSQERVSDSFEPFRLELRPKMVEDRVPSG